MKIEEDQVEADLTKAVDEETSIVVHKRCTRQLAQTVEKNVKFLLNLQKADQFTVKTASKNTNLKEDQEETDTTRSITILI